MNASLLYIVTYFITTLLKNTWKPTQLGHATFLAQRYMGAVLRKLD